jgi:predicted RNA-binding Zn-ribbon protein involved in translation (DUF1610 family)
MARRAGGRAATLTEKMRLIRIWERDGNASRACREAGFSRDSFYRLFDLYMRLGRDGLRARPRGRVAAQVELKILEVTRDHPEWGKQRVARALGGRVVFDDDQRGDDQKPLKGYVRDVSPNGVRQVWLRHGLTTQARRAAWAAAEIVVVCRECRKSSAVDPAKSASAHSCDHCGARLWRSDVQRHARRRAPSAPDPRNVAKTVSSPHAQVVADRLFKRLLEDLAEDKGRARRLLEDAAKDQLLGGRLAASLASERSTRRYLQRSIDAMLYRNPNALPPSKRR